MAQKPTFKVDWGNAGAEPSGAKKTAGHSTSDLDKPTANQFNWFWSVVTAIQNYVQGNARWTVIVDSDADEADYATLAAYIADSPAAGDRVLVKENQTSAVQVIIPAGITLKFVKGTKITFTANLANALQIGSDVTIEGLINVELTHTGTTVDGVSFNGDRANVEALYVHNSSTGTITNAIEVQSGKLNNICSAYVRNSGGGTITTVLSDLSTNITNNVVASDATNTYRSFGARTFSDKLKVENAEDPAFEVIGKTTLTGDTEVNLGSDDIYDIPMRGPSDILVRIPPPDFPNQVLMSDDTGKPGWRDKEDNYVKYLNPLYSAFTTSEGTTNGRLIDANANFTTLGVAAEVNYVTISGDSTVIIWQIDEVIDANTLQLRRSSHSLATDTIHKGLNYTIHEGFPSKEEWRELADFDTLQAGTNTDMYLKDRIILVECTVSATTSAAADDLIFSFAEHVDSVFADGPDISAGDRVVFYLWNTNAVATNNLNIKKGTAAITAQCKIYEIRETSYSMIQLIKETAANT